jgi:hypothetical protein
MSAAPCRFEFILYRTKKNANVPMLSFACFKLCHICVCWINGVDSRRVSGEVGQLTCSMGIDWMEVCILAVQATIPRKGFYIVQPHTFKGTVSPV